MKKEFLDGLTQEIVNAYESSVSLPEAEKLAAKFLHAQLVVTAEIQGKDLDARIRKSGLKAIKSAVRTEEVKKHDKKPAEGQLDDVVNLSTIVQGAQDELDVAEVKVEALTNYLNIFRDAHIYFRGIAKGAFNG